MAHRLSWEFYCGPIPEGLDILHRCDVPGCINPDHLFTGTHLENMQDMSKKGRSGRAKLTADAVLEIRSLYPALSVDKLTEMFNISRSVIYQVVKRRTWQHV